jgi:outer membrane protein assembly factor BamB
MKFDYRIAVCFIAAFAVGCSSDQEQIKSAKLMSFKPTNQFEVRWKQNAGAMDHNVLFPALTSNSVFATNYKGVIQRFDLTSGNRVWKIKTGFVVSGGVGTGDGLVFVGGEKGEVAAYDDTTGKLSWSTKVSSEVLSAPKFAEGVVVVRTGDGRIFGLNSKDGQRLWLYERATPALTARSNASVTIHKGIVYVGFAAGKLSAIGLHNGVIVWEASVSQPRGNTELERVSDITSLPILDDSQVCAVAFQGRLACLDAERGGTLWTRDIASDKGLTISRKYLFISDSAGAVFGLDKLSGSTYWKNDQLALRGTTAPLALDNALIVADFEGYLHALNRDDGHFLARLKTDGSAIFSAPIALEGGFVVLTSDGSLYSIVFH